MRAIVVEETGLRDTRSVTFEAMKATEVQEVKR